MKHRNRLMALFALPMLVGPIAGHAQYAIEVIDYPGSANTQVFGINDSGDAVGTGFDPNQPFIYASQDGELIDVAPADGYETTSIIGINDAGILVGAVVDLGGLTQKAFIRRKDGTYTVFAHPDAETSTEARGINNKGLVTGVRDNSDGFFQGFIYDPKSQTFTDVVPSFFTIVHGINSKGAAVGDARFEVDPCGGAQPFRRYGFVRAKDGTVTLFQVNGQSTAPRGINDAGKIVGQTIDPFSNESRGFVIDVPDENCASVAVDSADLFGIPGASAFFPEGITNSGDIVGIYIDADGVAHGFIAVEE